MLCNQLQYTNKIGELNLCDILPVTFLLSKCLFQWVSRPLGLAIQRKPLRKETWNHYIPLTAVIVL